jgi:hypothetical protein
MGKEGTRVEQNGPVILDICTAMRANTKWRSSPTNSPNGKRYETDFETCVAGNFNGAIFIVGFVKFASDGYNVLLHSKNRFLMAELSSHITSGTNAKLRAGVSVLLQQAKPYGRTINVAHIHNCSKRPEPLTRHSVTSQKIGILSSTTVRTSNLTRWLLKDVRLCVPAAGSWAGRVRAGGVCAWGWFK